MPDENIMVGDMFLESPDASEAWEVTDCLGLFFHLVKGSQEKLVPWMTLLKSWIRCPA